jgi:hypothetical protein
VKLPGKKKGGGGGSFEAQAGPRRARRIRDRIPRWVEITAAVAVILGFGAAVGPQVVDHFKHKNPVDIELGEVTVSNPRRPSGLSPETEPTVTATVRNDGEDTAWVDEARITVLDSTRIATCFTQGGGPEVPHTRPYRVVLPEFPSAEKQEFRHQLDVEVQPGHGARPLLRFEKPHTLTTDLYAIDVKYVVDPGEEVLDAGRFLIGVPGPPGRGGYVLPESQTALTSEEFRQAGAAVDPTTAWCLQHNLDGVRRMVGEEGQRSAEIAALSNVQTAPAWAEIEDHESPREAVGTLLESEAADAPIYAVEAAAETGDAGYEEEVRKRAVAVLMERAEEHLGDDAPISVEEVERARSLEPTAADGSLLAEAKGEAIVQEEQWKQEAEEDVVAAGD